MAGMSDQGPIKGRRMVKKSELGLRIISAVALIAIALTLTYWGPWPFAVLVAIGAAAMCWEWGQLVRTGDWDAVLGVHLLAVLAGCALTAFEAPTLGVLAILIGAILVGLLRFSRAPIASWSGVFYTGLPAIALIWLRNSGEWGFAAVLLILVIVWTCDTAAYAAGRTIGGIKLWPSVSPNKTWAGFLGGVFSAALAASLFALFVAGSSPGRLALIGLTLGVVSQLGDLGESALKRAFDVKDSSGLIPGHGGFLDRLDGLVTAALMAALIVWATDLSEPARSLMFGGH